MTTATRILKADSRSNDARRVRLADWSKPIGFSGDSSAFEPLTLPTGLSSCCEPSTDARLDSALAALQHTADQLHAERDRWLEQSQREAVRLGVAIAERLLRRTLDVQPEAVLDLIRSALDWSIGADHLRVRLHPADAELVESAGRQFDAHRTIEILPDNSLTRGDCVVETPNGQTDARLDVVLQRIADELLAE